MDKTTTSLLTLPVYGGRPESLVQVHTPVPVGFDVRTFYNFPWK